MKCPCEDCITFPICKQRFKNSISGLPISKDLSSFCSIIREYTSYKNGGTNFVAAGEVYEFYARSFKPYGK